MVYVGMLVFLSVLFEKTEKVIMNKLKEAKNQSERITKSRESMSDGQTRARAGEQRKKASVNNVSHIYRLNSMFLPFPEDGEEMDGR